MEAARRAGPRGHPRRAIDLGVVHVEARGNTARGDGLAQAIEKRIQPLVGIELGVRDEAAGVVERGLEEHLHFAGVPSGSGALNPRAKQHVRLPGLVGKLGFVLFVRGGFVEEQLTFRESAGAQEAVERGGREPAGIVLRVGRRQLAQQRGALPRGDPDAGSRV